MNPGERRKAAGVKPGKRAGIAVRAVIAIDSFKGSVSSSEGGAALARGLLQVCPDWEVQVVPVGDGGEGTLQAVYAAVGGEQVQCEVSDPLGRPVKAWFLLLPDRKTALIELAQASGLPLLAEDERNPLETTTYGTGQLIKEAVRRGARRIVLTVGGSATNDGGTGIATALGVRFLDSQGRALPPVGRSLREIERIDDSQVPREFKTVKFEVATDVRNPLYGPKGAAFVYAPQKGADREAVLALDEGLRRLGEVLRAATGRSVAEEPGAGAAGGVAASLVALFDARIMDGFDTVASLVQLDEKLSGAHVVVTGEGKLDAQTLQGKVPLGVARRAASLGVPTVAVAGRIEPEAERLVENGVVAFLPVVWGPITLEEAMRRTSELLRLTGRRLGYLLSWALLQ